MPLRAAWRGAAHPYSKRLAGAGWLACLACLACCASAATPTHAAAPADEYGIPLAVFWREIVPAMVIVLATAVAVSVGYVHLRREVRRRRDVEVRLAAARDLADSASLAKAEFFAMMSHEIRTPLSGIIGMLDLLKRAPMRGEQRQMLMAVDTSANALLHILDDVMDFSKAEANRMSLESLPVDLRALLQSVVMVIGEPARRRGVDTAFDVDGAVSAEVLGDPLRIRQILSNLISNAAKFTHHGAVRVTLRVDMAAPTHQTLVFAVTDTGIGIPAGKLAQIMAPFQQADPATARQYGGSGLGLSVSSRLAALMGGRLHLHSEAGRGTRAEFTCRFPIHRREPAQVRAAGTDARAPSLPPVPRGTAAVPPAGAPQAQQPLILVAEDHAINRDLIRRQLTVLGFACDVKEDAESALRAFGTAPHALLLTDCQMFPMDGYELARRWREAERHVLRPGQPRMPIVAMTAATERAAPALPHGDIDAYLFKPMRLDELSQALLAWLPAGAVLTRQAMPQWQDTDAGAAHAGGIALRRLQAQFGSGLAARKFVEQALTMLRMDLDQVQGRLCTKFNRDFALWLHRALGAMGMLGHWPILAEGAALERTLADADGADMLPDILPFLQQFEQTLADIARESAAARWEGMRISPDAQP